MRPDKNFEKLLFEMLKKQYVTCSSGACNKCYENKMGSCGTALTAQEISYELMENGYGNLKEAVKEFVEQLKLEFTKSNYHILAIKQQIDDLFKVLYGD